MKTDGQQFLEELAGLPSDSFDHRFAQTSTELCLGSLLERNELKLLYEVTLLALLCNAAINGIEEPEGPLDPVDEAKRREFELNFMEAREVLYASPGWQNLSEPEKQRVESTFLTVLVQDDRLAW